LRKLRAEEAKLKEKLQDMGGASATTEQTWSQSGKCMVMFLVNTRSLPGLTQVWLNVLEGSVQTALGGSLTYRLLLRLS
jgi:hypothetical protein